MKWFLMGSAFLVISTWFTLFQDQHDRHTLESEHVKWTAEQAAAAAAQYFVKNRYAEGFYVFNQAEGIQAAEYIIKSNLELDDNFDPLPGSYWTERVTYTIEFYDDDTIASTGTCTGYPCLYIHPTNDFSLAIAYPTVIVSIYTGKARYSIIAAPDVYRTGAYEWREY